MNEVFIIGKVEDIRFEFMYETKYISICIIKLKLRNESILEAYAYDEVADETVQKLKVGDVIFVNGRLRNSCKIEVGTFSYFIT